MTLFNQFISDSECHHMVQQLDNGHPVNQVTATFFTFYFFMGSSTRLWNVAPEEIKKALNFTSAKKIIKAYCKTLPI